MTLLKIDRGIDTGPVYGHFSASYDEVHESHLTIQRRMTYGNLKQVQRILEEFEAGVAEPISTAGRASAVWGQPTLSSYWKWKRAAKLRCEHPAVLTESLATQETLAPVHPVPIQPRSASEATNTAQELSSR